MNTLHCDKFWAWFFAVLWWPFWKWRPIEILQCRESIPDIIIYQYMKFRWNRTILNLCGIVATILKMAIGRNFSMSGINSGHRNLPKYEIRWNRTMLNLCGIVSAILKMAIGRNFSMSGHHYIPTYQILMISDNVEILPPICYAMFWQPFWKWQASWKFGKHRIAPLMVTYHYVKFYVSIIIHLEVININVRNFNFPIGFLTPFEPLKIWLWHPLPHSWKL